MASSSIRSLVVPAIVLAVLVLGVAACGDDGGDGGSEPGDQVTGDELPEVVEVEVSAEGGTTYRFDVTISSPYDRPDKYADAWRVMGPDGEVYGVRELAHPHPNEQPFTRSLDGVEIPGDVDTVSVEARDLVDGWSGQTVEIDLPS